MEIRDRYEMDGSYDPTSGYGETDAEDEERRRRRRERIAQMKREKERRLRMQRIVMLAAPAAGVLLAVCVVLAVVHGRSAAGGRDAADKTREEENFSQGGGAGGQGGNGQNAGGLSAGGQGGNGQNVGGLSAGGQGGNGQNTGGLSVGGAYPAPGFGEGGSFLPAPGMPVTSGEVALGNGNAEVAKPTPEPIRYSAQTTFKTAAPPEEVDSTNAIFIDLETGNILAQRDYRAVANPASMTKVLTVLVAAEHVTDLDDTFTMTIDITDYSYSNDCSSVGFSIGEVVTVRDLFYGTILPSGADAALALAIYTAGSHEAFVKMMNAKAEELGLSETAHFTNCVGLYNKEHHCSVYDMAMIMEAAIHNDICREVLTAHTYTTSATEQHPDGIEISNWFLRRIEDKDTGGDVICAKTGFVAQSGNCAVSYGVDRSGREYICATTGAHSAWRCIYDHVAMYKAYAQ